MYRTATLLTICLTLTALAAGLHPGMAATPVSSGEALLREVDQRLQPERSGFFLLDYEHRRRRVV